VPFLSGLANKVTSSFPLVEMLDGQEQEIIVAYIHPDVQSSGLNVSRSLVIIEGIHIVHCHSLEPAGVDVPGAAAQQQLYSLYKDFLEILKKYKRGLLFSSSISVVYTQVFTIIILGNF
jgi:hypothetical protein